MDRWVRTRSDEAAVDQGCWFDLAAADRVRTFASRFLRHSKGRWAGKPFEFMDWQWDRFVAPLYGWKRKDGTRRFRRAGCGVPKKNGKSTMLAALSLYGLVGDREMGAEVYSAAADRDQASIIYNEAANMVEASPALHSVLKVRKANKTIRFPRTKSVYKALSAEVPTKEGLNISMLVMDELHAQARRDLWDALRYGGISRAQPLLVWITTAGVGRAGLWWEQWQHAVAVQESSEIDTEFLPLIYETQEGEDWTDEAVWRKANPSFGVTMTVDDFRSDCDEAKRNPLEENRFKRYRLNMTVGQSTRWMPMARWQACSRLPPPGKRQCVLGLDLASTTDFVAAVNLDLPKVDDLGKVLDPMRATPYFWLPEEALERRDRSLQDRIRSWARSGELRLVPGAAIDYDQLIEELAVLARVHGFREVAIDPWNATHVASKLKAVGLRVKYVRQGYVTLSTPTKELLRRVLSRDLVHSSHRVLDWMMGNALVRTDPSGNVKPDKERSTEKIDGVSALVTALAYVLADTKLPSKYEKQGLFSVGGPKRVMQ